MKDQNQSTLVYNKQIDGLRCFAVLGVMLCHFIHFENVYFSRLPFGQGVNLFFVISGFLITKILLIKKEHIEQKETSLKEVIKSFFYRRSLRIFPIYYLLILFLLNINFQNTSEVWSWLVTYTTNFYISNDQNPYIGSFNHLWSLAVEEPFYLIWPFIMLFSPKKYIEKVIILVILSSLLFKAFYFVFLGYSTAINALTISCADSLGLGALIAYWSLYKEYIVSKINEFEQAIFLSCIVFGYFIIYPRDYDFMVVVFNNFLYSIIAFFIVTKASQMKFSGVTKLILENKMVIHIGKISYGIYLFHLFMPDFYNQMIEFFPEYLSAESNLKLPFLFVSSLFFAQCSWFLIEKPLMAFKYKY
jgi:peptidoglycan/LPS O-acetylase OafA/YrhL